MIYLIKIFFLIIILISKHGISNELKEYKISFEINKKIFTNTDIENRVKYIEILSGNKIENIKDFNKNELIEDYISSLIFNEYNLNNRSLKILDNEINIFYKNNIINNNIYKNLNDNEIKEIKKNIKIDLTKKKILERLLTDKKKILLKETNDLDLIYNYNLLYVIIENKFINFNIINEINDRNDLIKFTDYLNNQNISFFSKEDDINDITVLPSDIMEILNKKFKIKIIKNDKYTTIYSVIKNLESYEGVFAKLISIKTENKLDEDKLNCNSLESLDRSKIFKEYEYSKLNNTIKQNLKSKNDYIIINNGNTYDYIFLCDLKFNKEILNTINFNKRVKKLAKSLELKFLEKYKKEFNYKNY